MKVSKTYTGLINIKQRFKKAFQKHIPCLQRQKKAKKRKNSGFLVKTRIFTYQETCSFAKTDIGDFGCCILSFTIKRCTISDTCSYTHRSRGLFDKSKIRLNSIVKDYLLPFFSCWILKLLISTEIFVLDALNARETYFPPQSVIICPPVIPLQRKPPPDYI